MKNLLCLIIIIQGYCNSDRDFDRIDWTAGLPNKFELKIIDSINVLDYGAFGDGIHNDQPAFDEALKNLKRPGVLYIPDGSYLIDNTLEITTGDLIIRGQSSTNTKIIIGNVNKIGIKVFAEDTTTWVPLSKVPQKGDNLIRVSDPSLFDDVDFIEIRMANDPELMYTSPEWNVSYAQNLRSQILPIKKVKRRAIRLKKKFYIDYDLNFNPQIRPLKMIQNVGLERFHIEIKSVDTDAYTIRFQNAAHFWVREIESVNTTKSHIATWLSHGCQIENNYFHHSHRYDEGGHGYGVTIGYHTSDCLIENNVFEHLRHSMIIAKGSSGNVFTYNFSTMPRGTEHQGGKLNWGWIPPDLSNHGHWANNNLFEHNTLEQIDVGDWWGPAGPGNVYNRNHVINSEITKNNIHEIEAIHVQDRSIDQVILDNYIEYGYVAVSDSILDINTLTILGNNEEGVFDPYEVDENAPASYFYNCKPNFLIDTPWPTIGSSFVNQIPAEKRFLSSQKLAQSYIRGCENVKRKNKRMNKRKNINQQKIKKAKSNNQIRHFIANGKVQKKAPAEINSIQYEKELRNN